MKKTVFTLIVLVSFTLLCNAQREGLGKGFGFGFQIGQIQNDFGVGINVMSPFFANKMMAARLRGNLMWHQHLCVEDEEIVWSPYFNLSLGLFSVAAEVGGFMRLYGEGGVICLFPSDEFSSDTYSLGGFGLFGFEFFMSDYFSYLIEIGGVGIGAKADKIPHKPIYSNGLIINTGFRVQLE